MRSTSTLVFIMKKMPSANNNYQKYFYSYKPCHIPEFLSQSIRQWFDPVEHYRYSTRETDVKIGEWEGV